LSGRVPLAVGGEAIFEPQARRARWPRMRIHHLSCGTLCPFGGRLIDGTPGARIWSATAC